MGVRDDNWLEIADAFHEAAFGQRSWYAALEGLADATGSTRAGLISFGPACAVDLNLLTRAPPDLAAEYAARGGGDPDLNPRLRAALAAPLLRPFTEADFNDRGSLARNPFYRDFLLPNDLAHLGAAVLERTGTSLSAVHVVRTEAEGALPAPTRRLLGAFAPHVRTAFRAQRTLRDEGNRLVAGALGQLTLAGFICDEHRRVRATTPLGEAVASEESILRIRRGYLAPARHADVEEFAATLHQVARCREIPGQPFARSLIVHDAKDQPAILDVIALPMIAGSLADGADLLVLARDHARRRGATGDDGARMLQAAYRLAPAEAQIALAIADGLTAEEIARNRGVAVATVRVQLRMVFEKMGIRRQADLIILVNRLR